ncbi:MAG: type III-B CRISPR module-associated Cmr3 family protein [Venatoribacter sp.]
MNSYLLEPLAPLVFRTGKPFGNLASAQDVIFPLPSSAAGLVRALKVEQAQGNLQTYEGKLQNADYQELLSTQAVGPFLVRFKSTDKQNYEVLVSKPANALYFENKATGKTELIRLTPKAYEQECGADLPDNLLPVQMENAIKGKPKSGAAYWTLEHFLAWQAGEKLGFDEVKNAGLAGLPVEIRTHVAIDRNTRAAEDGKLFQTANFDLGNQWDASKEAWNEQRLGFLLLCAESLQESTAVFGGERRLSYFSPAKSQSNFLQPSGQLLSDINQAKGFSLTFLTPAVFAQGYLPAWIDAKTMQGTLPNTKVKVALKAVAIDRWLPVSGWDSIVWKPKATRKAVGVGSVYWFELQNDLTEADLKALWLSPLADHQQDKHDGFGAAIVAPWAQ